MEPGNASHSKLKEITLSVNNMAYNPGNVLFLMDGHVWRKLDTLLTVSSKFPDFEKFSLYIWNPPTSEWLQRQFSVLSVKELFCGYMPELWGKQMLDVRSKSYMEDDENLFDLSKYLPPHVYFRLD
jgi:hypothetical protein